jgi:multicomponent Na+:H+ antiporter subunit G
VSPADLLGGGLVVLGVGLVAVAGIGLVRLPDAYSRMSAVTKAASLGVVFVLLGALALAPSWDNAVKVLLAVTLQLLTAPVGGFAIGRASYRTGAPLAAVTGYDELAAVTDGRRPPEPGGTAP